MYYLIARYYHPEHGVFLSLDPDPGDDDDILTQNGYTYANNNPVMLVDPDGHLFWVVVNGGFAIYDSYKAYKAGKGFWGVLAAGASGLIGVGKLKAGYKLVKTAKGVKTVKKASKAKANPCNCFAPGTKVLTDEGEKNIEDIKVGDKVLAKSEFDENGELAYKEVTALYTNYRNDIIKIHIGDLLIETTDNHPFWVEGRGWVFADELKVGDKLQKADGSTLMIDKIEFVLLEEPIMVYNFTVEHYHTYYVTDLGIWVHNTYCPKNIKKVNDNYLKKKGINAHSLKAEYVGKKNISRYDLYVDKDTGMLWIYRKGGVGEPIPTYEYIK